MGCFTTAFELLKRMGKTSSGSEAVQLVTYIIISLIYLPAVISTVKLLKTIEVPELGIYDQNMD